MMSFQILTLIALAVISEASLNQAGSDAFATRNIQPNSDETQKDVVSEDVAEDIKQRQARRRAMREMKEQKLQAVRDEADARAKQAMEASRNATLAPDRARHQYHEQMRQAAEPKVVPSSAVVHLVRIPYKKNHTMHPHKNHTNQTQVATNKSGAVAQKPPLNNKALASKNITHTIEHANASRLNVTKAVERHKDQMSAKAGGISDASKAAASKGVTAAFHSARIAAEKLRKNHLAKRANIAKEKKSTSEESFEDQQKEKIKKNVIEVEGDELAEALKGVLSFPAKVPVATTTTTTKATTTVTSTVTVATTTVATLTTLAPKVTSTNVSTEVLAKNISQGTHSTADVNSKDAKEAELKEIEAEIQKDQVEKKEAIEKDDLETALAKKKELAELEKKEAALEAQAPVSNSTTLHLFHIAANKTTKSHAEQALKSPLNAARIAASKLRGSRD